MARQTSLFDAEPTDPNRIALTIRGSAPTLNRAYQRRVAEQIEPMQARLREARIAMAAVLDGALRGKALTKRERTTARKVLENLLVALIEQQPDPELHAVAERHGLDVAGADPSDPLERLESLGSEMFGVELDAGHGATTPEELLRKFGEKVEAEQAARAARRRPRAKSAKAREREARAEQAARDASQALREIYRKLARDLHPDRIADTDERARKTVLMQEANRAYEARDLLALLELQWRIEQIDPAHLTSLAEEKLAHFNHVLKEQAQCLREEIETLALPFTIHFDGRPSRDPRPPHVEHALDRELADLRAVLEVLQDDTARYADLGELRRDLTS